MKQYGLILEPISGEDYVLGGYRLPVQIIQEDGQWDEFLPKTEIQHKNGFDTYGCVPFGTLNCIETLYKKKYGEEPNYSERFIGVMAENKPLGNTPKKVAQTIHGVSGLIDDDLLDFHDLISSWEAFYSPKPMDDYYLDKGKEWLKNYDFKYEWVFKEGDEKRTKLIKALKFSPVGVSVYAWVQTGDYYTKPKGSRDNHWTMLYGYEEGKYWKIFDSYDNTHKKLAWNFFFGYAMRYHLEKKPETQMIENYYKQGFYGKLFSFFRKFMILR